MSHASSESPILELRFGFWGRATYSTPSRFSWILVQQERVGGVVQGLFVFTSVRAQLAPEAGENSPGRPLAVADNYFFTPEEALAYLRRVGVVKIDWSDEAAREGAEAL